MRIRAFLVSLLFISSLAMAVAPNAITTTAGLFAGAEKLAAQLRKDKKFSEKLDHIIAFRSELEKAEANLPPIESETEREFQYNLHILVLALDFVNPHLSAADCPEHLDYVLKKFNPETEKIEQLPPEGKKAYAIIEALCAKS